jgi:hypothetical protein
VPISTGVKNHHDDHKPHDTEPRVAPAHKSASGLIRVALTLVAITLEPYAPDLAKVLELGESLVWLVYRPCSTGERDPSRPPHEKN